MGQQGESITFEGDAKPHIAVLLPQPDGLLLVGQAGDTSSVHSHPPLLRAAMAHQGDLSAGCSLFISLEMIFPSYFQSM